MVDKSSLRSNKRSDSKDAKKGTDSKQPAKSSSRKTTVKKSTPGGTGETGDDKQIDTGAEDVDMNDTQDSTATAALEKLEAAKKVGGDGDVEMDDGKATEDGGEDKKDEAKEDPAIAVINGNKRISVNCIGFDQLMAINTEIKDNFNLLERAVTLFDARFTLRVLRTISSLRRRLTPEILARIVRDTYPVDHSSVRRLEAVIGYDGAAMEVDGADSTAKESPSGTVLPEVDIYIHLLTQIYLLDQRSLEAGAKFSTELVETIHLLNRRSLDSLAAKAYFYYARFHELLPSPAVTSIRPQLLASLRTATLRKDVDTQANLITLLLRNYLLTSHITQADHLVSKTVFPESAANNLIARYQYYLGRIRAIQLDYTAAHGELIGAIRKAPQTAAAAGFVQAANKLNIIVELLMGDIPERSIFREPRLEKALRAYFLLVQAVRIGELDAFFDTLNTHAETFKKDGTYSLILRLRQNVIKTGIRMMSLSYSKISLRDICVRLRLDSEESAEYIVAKAIRDGVIEATLNHEKGYMQSKELLDVYATQEPQEAFHERIMFCMSLHNDSVKVLLFCSSLTLRLQG